MLFWANKAFRITFYNEKAVNCLLGCEQKQTTKEKESDRLLPVKYERFFYDWKMTREESGVYLKTKDLRGFFSQEIGTSVVPDRYISIFQGRVAKNVLA